MNVLKISLLLPLVLLAHMCTVSFSGFEFSVELEDVTPTATQYVTPVATGTPTPIVTVEATPTEEVVTEDRTQEERNRLFEAIRSGCMGYTGYLPGAVNSNWSNAYNVLANNGNQTYAYRCPDINSERTTFAPNPRYGKTVVMSHGWTAYTDASERAILFLNVQVSGIVVQTTPTPQPTSTLTPVPSSTPSPTQRVWTLDDMQTVVNDTNDNTFVEYNSEWPWIPGTFDIVCDYMNVRRIPQISGNTHIGRYDNGYEFPIEFIRGFGSNENWVAIHVTNASGENGVVFLYDGSCVEFIEK